jgi:hypothetical protein
LAGFSHVQLVKKASQSFAAGAAKENQIIFSGDMCVGENTLRPANDVLTSSISFASG